MKKLDKIKIESNNRIPISELTKLKGGTWLCDCAVYFDGEYDGLHSFPCGNYASTGECDSACGEFWSQSHENSTCVCNWGY